MIRIILSTRLGERRWTQAKLAQKTGIRKATVNEIYNESGYAALPYLEKIAASGGEYADDAKALLQEDVNDGFLLAWDEPFQNVERSRHLRHVEQVITNAESFQIKVRMDTQTPVYGLGYACQLNGKIVCSGGMVHADKTPLDMYETMTVDRKMLPENADLSALDLRFSVYLSPDDEDQKETFVRNREETLFDDLYWGCIWEVQITESQEGVFYLQ